MPGGFSASSLFNCKKFARICIFLKGEYHLKPGDIVELNVLNTAPDGRGIGKINDFVIFINGACKGDTVTARIYTVHKTYATAGIVKVILPSPFRQDSFCPVSSVCGGCPLAYIQYEEQLAIKKQTVADALARIGGFDLDTVEISDVLGMDDPFSYRNKMVFPVGIVKGRAAGGFYASKSHDIVPLTSCLVGEPAAVRALSCVVGFLNDEHIAPFDEEKKRGSIRRVFVRTGYHTRELMVVVSSFTERIHHLDKLVSALRQTDFAGYTLKSIILNINQKFNNLVLGDKNITLWGNNIISDTIMGLSFAISPHSFFQINPVQTQVLYQKALDFAELDGTKTVLDVYCGTGTISLCAARHAKQVIGVEIVEEAVRDAGENAKKNGIKNTSFFCGSADKIVPNLINSGIRPDVVFLDPPRKGSDVKTLSAVLHARPERIVYISCNPATLARDARILADGGYRLARVVPVDMFPHTAHVETIVLLQRRNT